MVDYHGSSASEVRCVHHAAHAIFERLQISRGSGLDAHAKDSLEARAHQSSCTYTTAVCRGAGLS
jgi:hypothetical protein